MTKKEVNDYFLSNKFNTNIFHEDIIFEIDSAQIEKKENLEKKAIVLLNENKIKNSNSDFFGTYTNELNAIFQTNFSREITF